MATLPDGLVAVGGDLTPARLIAEYRRGVFPWYMPGQPVLWWNPDPRMVFPNCAVHVSRSLRKRLARKEFTFSLDCVFAQVITACAAPRTVSDETWITPEMRAVYTELHHDGYAHSVEVWQSGALVGGLYGIALGRVFFGESMFSRVTDASKAGFVTLASYLRRRDFALIDGQLPNPHLERLGGMTCARSAFLSVLKGLVMPPDRVGRWTLP
ncbi:MAG: leucyl/phenylalanyl-tRNA--protein transferase [Gammaproteobacteria bacterium]